MLALLKFTNASAVPKEISFSVARDAIKPIMAWYGAYHSGDRYSVSINDRKVKKDHNGELIGEVP